MQALLATGAYVPDEITNAIVRDRLQQPDAARGFLLDGYPRTKAQVAELDSMLETHGHRIDAVLELTADVDEVVQRLMKRAETEGRVDDTEDVIRHRQEVYVTRDGTAGRPLPRARRAAPGRRHGRRGRGGRAARGGPRRAWTPRA